MPYLIYARGTSVTGRALAGALGIPSGTRGPADRVDVLVRWGSARGVARKPENYINSKRSVELASNKLDSLHKLRQDAIPIPPFYASPDAVAEFPVVGRRTRHTQGRDIVLCLQRRDLATAVERGCSHFTGLLPKSREFRVHVWRGEVLKLSEKVLREEDKYDPVVWNFEHGFVFLSPRPVVDALKRQVEWISVGAVQSLGLDFGAADVVVSDDGRVRVLEVNTGPSLAEASLATYGRKIAVELGLEVDIPENLEEDLEGMEEEEDDE